MDAFPQIARCMRHQEPHPVPPIPTTKWEYEPGPNLIVHNGAMTLPGLALKWDRWEAFQVVAEKPA